MGTGNYFESKALIQKVKLFRKKEDLTFREIGEAVGVDKSHINRIVNGKTSPSLKVVIELARFMDTPLHSLFVPTEEVIREDFAEKVSTRLEEVKWNFEDLAKETEISELRIKDICKGRATLIDHEMQVIANILSFEIEYGGIHQVKIKNLLAALSDLGVVEVDQENILEYVMGKTK